MQAQHPAILNLALNRSGQLVKPGADRSVEGLAVIRQLHRLVLAREQSLADEFFKRGDPARERGRRQAKLIRRCPGRTHPDDAHESFDRAERG